MNVTSLGSRPPDDPFDASVPGGPPAPPGPDGPVTRAAAAARYDAVSAGPPFDPNDPDCTPARTQYCEKAPVPGATLFLQQPGDAADIDPKDVRSEEHT